MFITVFEDHGKRYIRSGNPGRGSIPGNLLIEILINYEIIFNSFGVDFMSLSCPPDCLRAFRNLHSTLKY
jgi:hypothetical protein